MRMVLIAPGRSRVYGLKFSIWARTRIGGFSDAVFNVVTSYLG